MHNRRRILLTFTALAAIVSAMAFLSSASYAVGNIHIIIVRSTTDPGLSQMSEIWQKRLEDALSGRNYRNLLDYSGAVEKAGVPGGLGASDVATYRTLTTAEETAPEYIMKTCLEVSHKAGPDDAVVCIVSCHGAYQQVVGGTKDIDRIHALAPLATSSDGIENNIQSNGIRRDTILKCLNHEIVDNRLQEKNHRLVVLITDSCASRAPKVKEESGVPRAHSGPDSGYENSGPNSPKLVERVIPKDKPYFKAFLETAIGVVDINSCNFGQRALYSYESKFDGVLGSLFINAFCRFANNGFYLDDELKSTDAFYKLLQLELARQIAGFNSSETIQQDLTRFKGVERVSDDKVPLVSPEEFHNYYTERAKKLKDSGEFTIEKFNTGPGDPTGFGL